MRGRYYKIVASAILEADFLVKSLFKLSTVKWKVFSLSNKNLAISTLCLVGLKPDDLNLLKMSIFFTFLAIYYYFIIILKHKYI